MTQNEPLTDFKTVVENFAITARTLRYYEELELIQPQRDGRQRFYTKRDIGRLKLILQGRRFGFKLEEIRQMLALYNPVEGNVEQIAVWLKKADAQLTDLRKRREELGEIIADLEAVKRDAERIISQNTQSDAT